MKLADIEAVLQDGGYYRSGDAPMVIRSLLDRLAAMTKARDRLGEFARGMLDELTVLEEDKCMMRGHEELLKNLRAVGVEDAPTPLKEIVDAAAKRFDERPLYRASVEAQRELSTVIRIVSIIINGRQREVVEGDLITYDWLYDILGDGSNPLTVTFRHGRGCSLPPGEMCAGDSVRACLGLVINAMHTGNA